MPSAYMPKRKFTDKISRFLRFLYLKLIKINDSPHKVAAGFAMGVFVGIMPFAGPFIALLLAFLLRVNRASALIGSFITNTWISIVLFFAAVKIGSFLFAIDGELLRLRWAALVKDFHVASLLKASVVEIILPVLAGYLAIAACLGFAAYGAARAIILIRARKWRKIKNGD